MCNSRLDLSIIILFDAEGVLKRQVSGKLECNFDKALLRMFGEVVHCANVQLRAEKVRAYYKKVLVRVESAHVHLESARVRLESARVRLESASALRKCECAFACVISILHCYFTILY